MSSATTENQIATQDIGEFDSPVVELAGEQPSQQPSLDNGQNQCWYLPIESQMQCKEPMPNVVVSSEISYDQTNQQQQPQQQQEQVPYCYGCGKLIVDEFVYRVMGATWHGICLRCNDCGEILQDRCFVVNRPQDQCDIPSLYCHRDYIK